MPFSPWCELHTLYEHEDIPYIGLIWYPLIKQYDFIPYNDQFSSMRKHFVVAQLKQEYNLVNNNYLLQKSKIAKYIIIIFNSNNDT